jgi:hypothetical protein
LINDLNRDSSVDSNLDLDNSLSNIKGDSKGERERDRNTLPPRTNRSKKSASEETTQEIVDQTTSG